MNHSIIVGEINKSYSHRLIHITIFLIAVYLSPANSQINQYPGWFVNPPTKVLTAVGYASTSYYPGNGIQKACDNALYNLTIFNSAKIKGEEGLLTSPAGQFYAGNTFTENIDSTLLNQLSGHVVYLDTVIIGNLTLVLASLDKINIQKILTPIVFTPRWISELPSSDFSIYAVGIGRVYFREISGWLEAERDARLQLALSLDSKIESLIQTSNNTYKEVIKHSVNLKLNNVRVVARTRANNILYVLVKMNLDE